MKIPKGSMLKKSILKSTGLLNEISEEDYKKCTLKQNNDCLNTKLLLLKQFHLTIYIIVK